MRIVCILGLFSMACAAKEPCRPSPIAGKDGMFFQIPGRSSYTPREVVESLFRNYCTTVEVTEVYCKQFLPHDSTTKVCYVASNEGFFFVTSDYLDNINVVYSRWD